MFGIPMIRIPPEKMEQLEKPNVYHTKIPDPCHGTLVRAGLLLFTIFFNSSQTCPGVTDEAIPALRMAARQLESWLQNREK